LTEEKDLENLPSALMICYETDLLKKKKKLIDAKIKTVSYYLSIL
jgi:hypothetical protein